MTEQPEDRLEDLLRYKRSIQAHIDWFQLLLKSDDFVAEKHIIQHRLKRHIDEWMKVEMAILELKARHS